MTSERFDLVCIGCGPAGEKAANQAAYFRHRVAIVEAASRPGGAMVNTGTLPSKTLRETALMFSTLRQRTIPGIKVEFSRNMSVNTFMARMHAVQELEHDRIESSFDRHGISVVPGRGWIVNPNTVRVTSPLGGVTHLHTNNILIATGSSPTRPAQAGFNHPRILDSDQLLNLHEIPESLAVIGGGVIGCEYACVFTELGVNVTLIEPREQILGFLDDEVRQTLLRNMEDAGAQVVTGSPVRTITPIPGDRRMRIVLENGKSIDCGYVLYAAGRCGNTRDLGLENIGVTANQRGYIPVDENYQTTCKGVYAAGDVIGFPALASTSMEQGRIAACHMLKIDYKKEISSILPIGLFTIPSIAMVGMTEKQARDAGHDAMTGKAYIGHTARGHIIQSDSATVHNSGFCKLVFEYPSRCLLGAQIIGDDATELIHVVQMLLNPTHDRRKSHTIDRFIHNVFNYPTLCEVFRYAAVNGLQKIALREGRDDQMANTMAKVA